MLNFETAKTSELMAFWNDNCEALGLAKVNKFTNKAVALRRVKEMAERLNTEYSADSEQAAEAAEAEAAEQEVTASEVEAIIAAEEGAANAAEEIEEEAEAEVEAEVEAAPMSDAQRKAMELWGANNEANGATVFNAVAGALVTTDKKPVEAAKAPRPVRVRASNSEGVAASWADPEVAQARLTRDAVFVTVDGETQEFTSTRAAFRFFRLPPNKCIRFRMKLKEANRDKGTGLDFEHEGLVYTFAIA